MSAPTEPKYYSFDLTEASKANPGTIPLIWTPRTGMTYELSEDIESISWICEIRGDRFLAEIDVVDNYGLVWDFADLDSIWNHLTKSNDLPDDIRQKMKTGVFSDLSGADFDRIPYSLLTKAYTDFKSHSHELKGITIHEIFGYSFLFAWAKAQVKAGNFEKV